MKKITKTLVALACVATLGMGVGAMAACNNPDDSGDKTPTTKTGEAYSLSHKGGYVAYSTVTLEDGKIKDVTLTEVELPNAIKYGESQNYAKVTYGSVTMLYDTEANTYKIGDKTMSEYFQTEANCKAYYEAAIGNKITAYETADGTANTTAMTKATLSKEENNYWMCDLVPDTSEGAAAGATKWDSHASAPYSANAYSRWKWNRDATVAYVKANGVEGLKTLKKATEAVEDNTNEKKSVKYWEDSNGVSTGATWSDLWYTTETAPTGYLTYAQLITNAYNAAK